MANERCVARVLRRTAAGPEEVEDRHFLDLEGDSLLAHLAKHVLDPGEGWGPLLQLQAPPPSIPDAHQHAAAVQLGLKLQNARDHLADAFGTEAQAVSDLLAFRGWMTAGEAKAFDAACGSSEARDWATGILANSTDDPEDLLYGPLPGKIRKALLRIASIRVHREFLAVLSRADVLAPLAAQVPEHHKRSIASAAKSLGSDLQPNCFFFHYVKAASEARAALRASLGDQERSLGEAYNREGFKAVHAAGLHPRHLEIGSASERRESYLDERGIGVVLGKSKMGFRVYTIHRPAWSLDGRRRLERAGDVEAILAAGLAPSVKVFLDQFKGASFVGRFSEESWSGGEA